MSGHVDKSDISCFFFHPDIGIDPFPNYVYVHIHGIHTCTRLSLLITHREINYQGVDEFVKEIVIYVDIEHSYLALKITGIVFSS